MLTIHNPIFQAHPLLVTWLLIGLIVAQWIALLHHSYKAPGSNTSQRVNGVFGGAPGVGGKPLQHH